ncbi:MAG: OprO/OprP family phosphate-selective porin [Gemmatimonadota bacterium]|nr:OprO/OprP family phosphate-selective porin [Gemmatimonadota bacterium]
MFRALGLFAVALLLLVPTQSAAQLQVSGRGATLTLGGLLQPQYTASSVESADNDFMVRRARLRAEVMVNDFIGGRVLTEFGGGSGIILDAYMSLAFSEGFNLSVGQFKRAFDIFELPSPGDLPEIERDGRIEGYAPCASVGSICSFSRLTEGLSFAGRDIGVRVDGSSGALSYLATLTNGTGLNTSDQNDRKSLSGRVTYAVNEDVSVSGQLGLHDYVDPSGNATAVGFGGEVEVGTWRDGLHVRGAVVTGDNWRDLTPVTFDPATFLTFQGIVTYYYPMDSDRLVGVEPLARLSFGDPNTDTDGDGGVLITPGVMFYINGRTRIGANLDIYSPQTGDKEFSLGGQTTFYF